MAQKIGLTNFFAQRAGQLEIGGYQSHSSDSLLRAGEAFRGSHCKDSLEGQTARCIVPGAQEYRPRAEKVGGRGYCDLELYARTTIGRVIRARPKSTLTAPLR